MSLPTGVTAPTDAFPWPTLPVDIDLLKQLSDRTVQPGNQYEFGGKVSLDADSSTVAASGIDCSGYVRWLLHRATKGRVSIPDGSAVQHDWFKEHKFKLSSVASACLMDGVLRVAFLPPSSGIGHVLLIRDGQTFESHGSAGPNRRTWTGRGYQGRCRVYVCCMPYSPQITVTAERTEL